MKVNWPERIWVNSPVRRWVQQREAGFFKAQRNLAVGSRCLEIGCGCGVGARLIDASFAPDSIDALDLDPQMISLARRKQRSWGFDRLRLLAGDAQQLPYRNASFDAVFNFGIVHHLEDWQSGIREVARVLIPGGAFYFEEIYPPLYANPLFRHLLDHPRENRFHGPEYRAFLEECGLKLLQGYKESRFAILGIAVKEGR
ncbi:MAG: class I SAM-dependent methyltransferase [Deltaproteobacteria bacterium]